MAVTKEKAMRDHFLKRDAALEAVKAINDDAFVAHDLAQESLEMVRDEVLDMLANMPMTGFNGKTM